jgi:putative transposase
MKVNKSFNYRLYPTEEQKVLLSRHFGHTRFVYNYFLRARSDYYLQNKNSDIKKSLNYYDNANYMIEMKKSEEFNWLKEVNAQSLQQALRQLDVAYNKFFRKQSKFPNFKKRSGRNSFTIPQHISVEDGSIQIPKFKEGIKLNYHKELEGEICFATVSKTSAGNYYCSITCEVDIQPFPKTGSEVGIDLGIKDYAILSNGVKYDNPRYFVKGQKVLTYRQNKMSKVKNKESRTYKTRKLIVARTHAKNKNKRKDYLHKLSTELVKNHDLICLESLNVKGMIKNHKLAKHISDASWGNFVNYLEYKCQWYGKELIKIDRFFPSSKTCSECGWQKDNLKLSDREWVCEECGIIHDRDINASRNILAQGIQIRSGSGIESDYKQKLEEPFLLEKAVSLEAHSSSANG